MLLKAFLVVFLAIICYFLQDFLLRLGWFRHFHKHYPGECRQVKGLDFGSEDLEVTSDGIAFITSGIWYPSVAKAFDPFSRTHNIKGNIFIFDLNKPKSEAVKLKLIPSKDFNPDTFHPHGLSLLEDNVKGEHLLYVISHVPLDVDRIEKFRFKPKTKELEYVRSFFSDKFVITNDLTLIGEDQFYITNFLYFTSSFMAILEQALTLPLCNLVFFNGTDAVEAVSGLSGPNGVYLSKDKRYLYLNMPYFESLEVYEVKQDKTLSLVQSVPLYTGIDNIHPSPSGDALFIGCHPVLYKVLQMLSDPNLPAPSSVLHLPLRDGKVETEDVTEVFYDQGHLISGSSVAAMYNNHMLIGSVIGKLVICSVDVKLEK